MQELEIILNSDLCAGNGESAGNSVDSDVCIDDAGIPYIPSRRIKGCLKQAAFDLKKMGYTLASDSNIIDLFGDAYGNEGAFSICDAMIKDANGIRQYLNTEIKNSDNSDEIKDMAHASKLVNLFTSVRGQTMLDDGCKVDNSLRFTRVVNQYDPLSLDKDEKLAFYAPIYFNFCDDDKKELRELFVACCKATRHIGHSRNRGLGNVSIKLCEDSAKQVKHGIQLGARTTRGYGTMKVEARKHQFDFPNCIDEWLDFNPWSESDFSGEKVFLDNEDKSEAGQFDRIEVQFKVIGSFSIRVNMERIEKAPDSVVMVNKDDKPVIPGTTWAGVFRHHMQEILSHIMSDNNDERTALDCLFGRGRADNTLSRIRFGETVIEGGKTYVLTRNAVERCTQAPKNSALFTDEFWQGGVGTLEIMIDKGKMSKLQRQLLEVSLLDLDNGMLTFGASTGTGHGRVEVMKLNVNGMDYTENLKSGSMGFLEGLHEY